MSPVPPDALDAHAHVFVRGLPNAVRRRYLPDYDAAPESYLNVLARHGIAGAVLVQPSFLGTDNGFLLRCLARHPDRFRGVLVLDENRLGALAPLAAGGVAGVRINLIGREVPDLRSSPWRGLAAELARRGQHLEVQATGEQWSTLAPALRGWPSAVVIDHLGLPGRSEAADRCVRDLAARDQVWVKVSGTYRSAPGAAADMLRRILDEVGPDRLLWGSDWPWTQHEPGRRYADCFGWLASRVDARILRAAMATNPARLLSWKPLTAVAEEPRVIRARGRR